MEAAGLTVGRKQRLHRRALRLEYFTVSWNVIEALVAITAGVIAGSVALVGFGVDSGIEVISAVAFLWRFRTAGADADAEQEEHAERRALYAVALTFFLLAAYIGFEAISALVTGEEPDSSTVGLVLSVVSLAVMPTLAYWKQRTGREMGSRALQADAIETWVCSYLSLALLAGVGLYAAFGWGWADPVGALLMLPVILWQGWETLEEAREDEEVDQEGKGVRSRSYPPSRSA
jgi:cation diffusion facilitator family transporter